MISLEECRKILGDQARGLSDAELEVVRQQAHGFARLLLSIYLDKKAEGVTFTSKEPPTAKPDRGAAGGSGKGQRRDKAGAPETVGY
ncbi:MAG TPA: hypothetical protein VNM67_18865 [Thermoanaerobaculia bacterium]|jgi:hypothetical protein|nr:hypothetical protein [Thermoanaerobaculia bacterium]